MAYLRRHVWALRLTVLSVSILVIAAGSAVFIAKGTRPSEPLADKALAADQKTSPEPTASALLQLLPNSPLQLTPVTPPPPPPPPAPVVEVPKVIPRPKVAAPVKPKAVVLPQAPLLSAAPPSRAMDVYSGLGAWVDRFDIIDPESSLTKMSQRGVRTLYFQSGRYKDPDPIFDPARLGTWIDTAHRKGIAVVCWYVPGFGDVERDVSRTRAVIDFTSPEGGHCDGFAPDIETGDFAMDRARFNAGVEEYSQRIRDAAGGRVLGAIVVDAKNNERAAAKWAGFPWRTIGKVYDVVLPMAYWSVTKAGRCATEFDAFDYVNQVIDKTRVLMEDPAKPMHIIGGIANCQTVAETQGFVRAVRERHLMGGSLYDFVTTQETGLPLWSELAHLN